MVRIVFLFAVGSLLFACGATQQEMTSTEMLTIHDPHSFSRPDEARVKHLNLNLNVNFDQQVIQGIATYDIECSTDADTLILDVHGISVNRVTTGNAEQETTFELGAVQEYLGQSLNIALNGEKSRVTVHYQTHPKAEALQWLTPEQTAGKKHPFLFTQSQAILARTWVPCQDSPGIRFTYEATVQVPPALMAVMSASNPTEKSTDGRYTFTMQQPIPSYLMALAVGDLEFNAVGERTGVYAEPVMMEKSLYEFADMENMLLSAEKLYGPYAWERYDLIVLPPSFPFGGMENPRLTFATPTIIAGDRSLTALVAHELAHSWSGNLVTNATWNDFWLNEGFTVYFEQRIMEALYGREYSEMLATLSFDGLKEELAELEKENNKDTHLKLDLANRNPDDGMTAIAYDKGYFFLRLLEETVGREQFDAFLKGYFQENAFKVMDTEAFIDRLKSSLLDSNQLEAVRIDEWVYGPGLPSNCPKTNPSRFEKVDSAIASWQAGTAPNELTTTAWSTHEWLHFLKNLPEQTDAAKLAQLDDAFRFTESGNNEILAAWFQLTIRNKYAPADDAVEQFLINVGRRKFLTPTYKALVEADPSLERPRAIYAKARPNYHSVSYQTIDEIVKWQQ